LFEKILIAFETAEEERMQQRRKERFYQLVTQAFDES
jgi:hypothetical protein